MRILRSMLFIPANQLRMIRKAGTLGADAVILDLEDAVPMADKGAARHFIRDWIPKISMQTTKVYVRVNALTTGLTNEDLEWVVQPGIEGIVLPKTESAKEVGEVDQIIARWEAACEISPGGVSLVTLIENARGLLNVVEIASMSRVIAIAFGALDYTRDLGISLSRDRIELLFPRSQIVLVAKAINVLAIDTPWIELDDREGLIYDATQARNLGFNGKLLIHPNQIEPINEIFSPSADEVTYARNVITAFEEAEAVGSGVISLDGKMIDVANYRYAKDLVARAEAIGAKKIQQLDYALGARKNIYNLIAYGRSVAVSIVAADLLSAKGISLCMLDMHTSKPIDLSAI